MERSQQHWALTAMCMCTYSAQCWQVRVVDHRSDLMLSLAIRPLICHQRYALRPSDSLKWSESGPLISSRTLGPPDERLDNNGSPL